jgi:rhodanese-related sulfurtransferase
LLPDETLVYPAHGAGSLCGKQLSSDTVSSLGDQRRFNYALQPMTKQMFIRLVTTDQPDAPQYFTYDAVLNTREHATLDKNLEEVLHPMELNEVIRLGDAGAQILDMRDASEYAKGHLAGSINIGLGGQYATWAGRVLDPTKPIVIIAEPGRELEAALRLGRIGLDHVRGYLRGGCKHSLIDRTSCARQNEPAPRWLRTSWRALSRPWCWISEIRVSGRPSISAEV